MSQLFSATPADLLGAAFSLPLFSLLIALPVAVAVTIGVRARDARQASRVTASSAASITERHRPEFWLLRSGAAVLVVLFGVENILHGYVLNLRSTVEWWRYAVPEAGALLVLAALLVLILTRGTKPPEEPVVSVEPRTWTTFAPRWGLVGAGLAVVATVLTVLLAGSASSTLNGGPHIFLEIPVPNAPTAPLVSWFFGWAYGIPVLLCLIALAGVLWAALQTNAVRPFLRADTAHGERAARRAVASGALMVATSSILLTLSGAWRLIADAGHVGGLQVEGRSYDVVWQHGEFAAAVGWAAPVLEICAFVLLLVVSARPLRGQLSTVVVETEPALPAGIAR